MKHSAKKSKHTKTSSKCMPNMQEMMMIEMQESFYRKVNPRREQEIMDSRMIQENHHDIANLPTHEINRIFDPNKYMQSLGRKKSFDDVFGA